MLPLRPVDALEYDPSHCPASAAMSPAVPDMDGGGWCAGAQAVTRAASAACRVLVRELIGRSVVWAKQGLIRKTCRRRSWLHAPRPDVTAPAAGTSPAPRPWRPPRSAFPPAEVIAPPRRSKIGRAHV